MAKNAPEKIKVDENLKHIAFIMDGNGRWAKKRALPREFGHKQGAQKFKEIVRYCGDIGINAVTVYAFSTENWKRPEREVKALMRIFESYIDDFAREMMHYDIKIKFIGDLSKFNDKFKQKVAEVEEYTKDKKLHLNVAINYGGRDEIVHAFKKLAEEGKTDITEDDISRSIYTAGCPDPDIIVRTGGDMRISNFLLWQSAYSELYFTDTLWPDMTPADVDAAITEFYSRKRRFGGLG
jgi:undecaprenyl diphosphate synthase